MHIVVSNPNRVPECEALIASVAVPAAAPHTVEVLSPRWGPRELTGQRETLLSAIGVLDALTTRAATADAIVLAGFGEPGSEAVREALDAPVVDITEAGPMAAMLLGRRYAVVTSTEAAVPVVEDRLHTLGLDARCSGVLAVGRSVPELMGDHDGAVAVISEYAKRAVTDLRAEVIVLGCGGMSGLDREVAASVGVPVVDPLRAAVGQALVLAAAGWRTSRALAYSAAGQRRISGLPLSS